MPDIIVQSINRSNPLTSTDRFFAGVDELFTLLDIDGNERVDYTEAMLGLHECFDRVHRTDEPLTHSAKQAAVRAQTQWLFQATHHQSTQSNIDPNVAITRDEFSACYHRLLESAYEMEVLMLDLTRAIEALTQSNEWQTLVNIVRTTKSLYPHISNDRHKRQSCFAAFESNIVQVPSSRSATEIQSVIQNVIQVQTISETDWLHAWKQICTHSFDRSAVLRELQKINEEQ